MNGAHATEMPDVDRKPGRAKTVLTYIAFILSTILLLFAIVTLIGVIDISIGMSGNISVDAGEAGEAEGSGIFARTVGATVAAVSIILIMVIFWLFTLSSSFFAAFLSLLACLASKRAGRRWMEIASICICAGGGVIFLSSLIYGLCML